MLVLRNVGLFVLFREEGRRKKEEGRREKLEVRKLEVRKLEGN
ncbi:hypothetical protein [Okeania sp. SIO2C2]|nr:hypothetical protein [Okeania sp. SIO2C2]